MPYGDYSAASTRHGNTENLQAQPGDPDSFAVAAERLGGAYAPAEPGGNPRIRTNVQLWKSQYNPYNIGLNVVGDARPLRSPHHPLPAGLLHPRPACRSMHDLRTAPRPFDERLRAFPASASPASRTKSCSGRGAAMSTPSRTTGRSGRTTTSFSTTTGPGPDPGEHLPRVRTRDSAVAGDAPSRSTSSWSGRP